MSEHAALSNQKHSDDPRERAFATYVERRAARLRTALIGHLSAGRIIDAPALEDFVWDQALDFVAPMEPEVRDDLRRAGTGLPWVHRGDPELYWRLMYAARLEMLVSKRVDVFVARSVRRPLMHVVSATTVLLGRRMHHEDGSVPDFLTARQMPSLTAVGEILYLGIIDRAAREVRLRTGLQRGPRPLELASSVRIGNVPAVVEGYGFDGSVAVGRETEPAERGGLEWSLDVRIGRWVATVWPWQLEPVL